MTGAATTSPPARRNTPQSLRQLLILCWLVLVLQIWFASESDDFLDPQLRHDQEGRYFEDKIDMPRVEEVRAEVLESNYVQFGDGRNVMSLQKGGMGAVGMETVDALPAAVVQSEEAIMTEEDMSDDVQNYTQHVNISDAVSANLQNQAQHVNVSDDFSSDVQKYKQNISTIISNRSDDTSYYDCSIVWVRVPKTASTTIFKTFMQPLANWFQNTHIGPNTCISQPGGCSLHWNSSLGVSNNQSTINMETACIGASKGECFEYDNTTKTTNFGPSGEVSNLIRNKLLLIGEGRQDLRRQFDGDNNTVIRRVADDGNIGIFSPSVNAHVGLHTSLINNVLPPKPMVFSAFREPKERLLSSFHYGIVYGAGKPGQVQNCNPNKAGWKGNWHERVATARRLATESNNTMHYQTLLRHYLEQCKDATWNMYTQFLDPATKDVHVALQNLEKYVIVGLQTNITETLQLWANTMRKSCRHRPDYDQMAATILLKPYNEQEEKREMVSIAVKHSVVLVTPNITEFDDDLKDLFDAYTKEDEIIYNRAKELYAEQRKMMLN